MSSQIAASSYRSTLSQVYQSRPNRLQQLQIVTCLPQVLIVIETMSLNQLYLRSYQEESSSSKIRSATLRQPTIGRTRQYPFFVLVLLLAGLIQGSQIAITYIVLRSRSQTRRAYIVGMQLILYQQIWRLSLFIGRVFLGIYLVLFILFSYYSQGVLCLLQVYRQFINLSPSPYYS